MAPFKYADGVARHMHVRQRKSYIYPICMNDSSFHLVPYIHDHYGHTRDMLRASEILCCQSRKDENPEER